MEADVSCSGAFGGALARSGSGSVFGGERDDPRMEGTGDGGGGRLIPLLQGLRNGKNQRHCRPD